MSEPTTCPPGGPDETLPLCPRCETTLYPTEGGRLACIVIACGYVSPWPLADGALRADAGRWHFIRSLLQLSAGPRANTVKVRLPGGTRGMVWPGDYKGPLDDLVSAAIAEVGT